MITDNEIEIACDKLSDEYNTVILPLYEKFREDFIHLFDMMDMKMFYRYVSNYKNPLDYVIYNIRVPFSSIYSSATNESLNEMISNNKVLKILIFTNKEIDRKNFANEIFSQNYTYCSKIDKVKQFRQDNEYRINVIKNFYKNIFPKIVEFINESNKKWVEFENKQDNEFRSMFGLEIKKPKMYKVEIKITEI